MKVNLVFALLVAVHNKRDALIISDSKSALQSLNKEKALQKNLVNKIQKQQTYCRNNGQNIMFMWVPAHVSIPGNETADKLAKAGSRKTCAPPEKINLKQLRRILQKESAEERELAMIGGWCDSPSIKHYEKFVNIKHCYGKANILAGPCDRIAARIRLGYRKVWELNQEKKKKQEEQAQNIQIACYVRKFMPTRSCITYAPIQYSNNLDLKKKHFTSCAYISVHQRTSFLC